MTVLYRYSNQGNSLLLFKMEVIKQTDCYFTVVNPENGKEKRVRRFDKARWAFEDIEEAKIAFKIRKNRQLQCLKCIVESALFSLNAADAGNFTTTKDSLQFSGPNRSYDVYHTGLDYTKEVSFLESELPEYEPATLIEVISNPDISKLHETEEK